MNTSGAGSESSSRKSSLVMTYAAPSIAIGAGLAPVAMTMARDACSVVSSTAICDGDTDRAAPSNVSTPSFGRAALRAEGTGSVKLRLNRINAGQSIAMPSARTPLSASARALPSAAGAPTRTFFGSQPRSAQVPPNGRRRSWRPFTRLDDIATRHWLPAFQSR